MSITNFQAGADTQASVVAVDAPSTLSGLATAIAQQEPTTRITLAALFTKGELDVEQMVRTKQFVSDALLRNPLVNVKACGAQVGFSDRAAEPVFEVSSMGVFRGHYRASAFKSLSV